MISFSFTPTKNDYVKAFRAYYFSNLFTWIGIALLLLVLFPMTLVGLINGIWWLILLFGFVAFVIVFAIVINPLIISNKVEKNNQLSSLVQYKISDEQILIKNQFAESKLDWLNFQNYIETKEYFLIVYSVNKNMFQIIPKRAFSSSDDEQVFRQLLSDKNLKSQSSNLNFKKNPVFVVGLIAVFGFSLLVCCTTVLYLIFSSTQ